MNNKNKKRLTALSLVSVLFLGGCSNDEDRKEHFVLTENDNDEIVAVDDSYIDKDYIKNYYVVEVYNNMNHKNEIYIGLKKSVNGRVGSYWGYIDVFSNLEIVSNRESEEDLFNFVKVTCLEDYIIAYGLGQLRYSYDDMKNIYEVIKENYVFESDNSLRKTRKFDGRI